jgi:hypothetical protein
MRKIILVVAFVYIAGIGVRAQEKINRAGMSYLIGLKPNNILYRDTLYKGSTQFLHLFTRTQDTELIHLVQKHQSNKLAGNIFALGGTVASIFGVSMISGGSNKGTGWALLGGGFVASLTGGYLIFRGQQNLQSAVGIFNYKYNRTALSIGIGDKQAGLVLKF